MNLGLILFISFVTLFIGAIFLFAKIFPRFESVGWGTTLAILWGFILFACSVTTYNTYESSIEYTVKEHKYYIHSLGNDKYLEGDFGLFTGTLDQKDYYFFYVNYTTGYGREKILTSNAYIVEGNYSRPEVKAVYKKYKDENRFWKIWDEYEPEYYIIYVPKGTIIRDFKVR